MNILLKSLPENLVAAQSQSPSEVIWQLQTNWPWAPWFTLLFALLVTLGIASLYAHESSPAKLPYRALLVLLRLVSIALVLVMLSEVMFTASRTGLPRLVVLIDHSASMGLTDALSNDRSTDLANDRSRFDLASDYLISKNGEVLQHWREQYEVELLAVADGTAAIEGEMDTEWIEQLQTLQTTGQGANRSRLGDALAVALDERRGPPPAAVVLLTDGRTTAGRSLGEASELARRRGVPLYTVGFGPTTPPPDLRLTDLLADEQVLVGDPVAIGVTLEASGMAGQKVRVRVRDLAAGGGVAGSSASEQMVEQTVEIPSDNYSQSVQLLVHPKQQGAMTYRIEVEPVEGEQNQQNNHLEHRLEVRDEKVRVLLAAGYPHYEFRYLKNLLDRDSTFELTSYLQEADVDYAEQDATAVAQLPMQWSEMEKYDVVVLMDLNPRLLPPRWWKHVERHVIEQGGGLLWMAGPRYFPRQYGAVPVAMRLAPVEFDTSSSAGNVYDSGYALKLTPLGQNAASLQLATSSDESLAVWQGLPPFYWYSEVASVKPAAQILATHPTARTPQGRPVPLLVRQYVGAGRVLYHGFDASWRWRFRVGDVFFARYWGQTLRYLARSKIVAGEQQNELLVDQSAFELGQPVRLQLRLAPSYALPEGTTAELLLQAEGQPRRRLALFPSRLSPNLWQATASDLPPGKYRAILTDPRLSDSTEEIAFEVVAPPGELTATTMNEPELRSLAEETYGKFYASSDIERLTDDLPQGERLSVEALPPVELWNRWWMLLAITGCLTTEWILRKHRAML